MPIVDLRVNVDETGGFEAVKKLFAREGLTPGTVDGDALIKKGLLLYLQEPIEMGSLTHGMQSGDPSVGLVFTLPSGQVVVFDTSLRILVVCVNALVAAHEFVL